MLQLTTKQSDVIHSDEANERRQDGENSWPSHLHNTQNIPLLAVKLPTLFYNFPQLRQEVIGTLIILGKQSMGELLLYKP